MYTNTTQCIFCITVRFACITVKKHLREKTRVAGSIDAGVEGNGTIHYVDLTNS